MDPERHQALSDLAFIGFCISCAVVGVITVCEIGVWIGILRRPKDDE